MRFAEFEHIQTPRLLLRKISMADAPAYFTRLAGSETVTRYMTFAPQKDVSEAEASVKKALARLEAKTAYRWVIDLEGEGLIGVIDLLGFDEGAGKCSFAYMLAEEFWGRGYGTEAVKAVFDFAFSKMELQRIEADHMAENIGSGAVMRKAGMTYQRTDKAKYEKNGVSQDAPVYAITREDWLKMQSEMQGFLDNRNRL